MAQSAPSATMPGDKSCPQCMVKEGASSLFPAVEFLEPEPTPFPETDGWIAGETSVSILSREEQDRLLGIPFEVFDRLPSSLRLETTTPPIYFDVPREVDWRDYEGKDWTTPIRNQAGCASCSSFGTIAAIESRLEIAIGNPDLNPDLSEAQLFFCGCGDCCSSGWFGDSALDFARDIGIVREECFPYLGYYQPCELCTGWQNQVTRISDWYCTRNIAQMKWELAHHGPIITSIHVHDDFFSYTGGIYRYTWGESRGGHFVALVGYNDEQQYWIGKNSWGTGWGEGGWFRIAYGDSMVENYITIPIIESYLAFFPIILQH